MRTNTEGRMSLRPRERRGWGGREDAGTDARTQEGMVGAAEEESDRGRLLEEIRRMVTKNSGIYGRENEKLEPGMSQVVGGRRPGSGVERAEPNGPDIGRKRCRNTCIRHE